MPTPNPQPTLESQIALVAGLQERFHRLLEECLDGGQLAEALQIARWLNDSALCIARLKHETAQHGSGLSPLLARSLELMDVAQRKKEEPKRQAAKKPKERGDRMLPLFKE